SRQRGLSTAPQPVSPIQGSTVVQLTSSEGSDLSRDFDVQSTDVQSPRAAGKVDPVEAHTGVVTETGHSAMRADIRKPGAILGEVFDRIAEASIEPGEVTGLLARAELRPVFTAHPTEASRQSVLRSLRRVAELLGADLPESVRDRQLREVVELLWLTDEIRPGKPSVQDDARN